jgi:hypothetical protein
MRAFLWVNFFKEKEISLPNNTKIDYIFRIPKKYVTYALACDYQCFIKKHTR